MAVDIKSNESRHMARHCVLHIRWQWRHLLFSLYGQRCRLHVVGQRVASDISVIRSRWSICSLCCECDNANLLLRLLIDVDRTSASNIKHSLPYNMAACTWLTTDTEFSDVTTPYLYRTCDGRWGITGISWILWIVIAIIRTPSDGEVLFCSCLLGLWPWPSVAVNDCFAYSSSRLHVRTCRRAYAQIRSMRRSLRRASGVTWLPRGHRLRCDTVDARRGSLFDQTALDTVYNRRRTAGVRLQRLRVWCRATPKTVYVKCCRTALRYRYPLIRYTEIHIHNSRLYMTNSSRN